MALVNLAPVVTFTFVDESGSTSNTQVSIPAATTVADARIAANDLVPLLEAASSCVVTGYSIAFSTTETAPAAPDTGSRVENKGNFVFRTAAGKLSRIALPGITAAVVLPSQRIDDDAPAVAALTTALLGTPWSDSNGSDLTALVEAYQSFRTSTKGQNTRDRKPDAA